MATSTTTTRESRADEKRRARILEGAMQVFLAYGFSRTTMDDIAKAVDLSRPALYLLFRNKADIFRAVVQSLLERSGAEAQQALRAGGPLVPRLMEALDRALFQIFRMVDESPHGEELVDVNHDIAADIVAEWRRQMVGGFADAIAEEARRRGVRLEDSGLSPQALAEMLFDVMEGLKARGLCGLKARESTQQFITLVDIALRTENESG